MSINICGMSRSFLVSKEASEPQPSTTINNKRNTLHMDGFTLCMILGGL
jgi:hypothetical protein